MAGPTIIAKILGDFSSFGKSVASIGTAAESSASKLHTTFSSALGALNATGVLGPFGSALQGVDQALDQIGKHGKDVGLTMIGVGGALAGVGVGLSALGSKDQAAHQQLQAAVEATGKSYEDYAGQVDAAIKHQEKFGDSAAETQQALMTLTQATHDPQQALNLLGETTDLAAAKHMSLNAAATAMGRTYNGNTRLLKQFGITVETTATAQKGLTTASKQSQSADEALAKAKQNLATLEAEDAGKKKLTASAAATLQKAQQAVTDASAKAVTAHKNLAAAQDAAKAASTGNAGALGQLAGVLKGQASAQADTFTGRLKAMGAVVEDRIAEFGQRFGPAITVAGSAMTGLGAAISVGTTAMNAAKAAAIGTRIELMGLSVAEKAQAVASAAGGVIVKGAMLAQAAATKVAAAAQWLFNAAMDANPLVLIILAIVALVAAIVYLATQTQVFQAIWRAFSAAMVAAFNWVKGIALDVFHWIEANWPLLLGILLGPIALAAALIYKYWAQILSGLQAVWSWIRGAWSAVTGFLIAPVAAAIGWIEGAFNSVVGFFAGLPGRILSGLSSLGGMLASFFGRLPGIILGAIGNLGSLLYNAGVQIIQGLINGIGSLAGAVSDKVTGIMNTVKNLPGKILGMLSPSKVFFEHGQNTLQGYINGLNTMQGAVNSAMASALPVPNLTASAAAGGSGTPGPVQRTGPAVNIENVHLSEDVDMDTFMKRAAWHVQTAGI